MCILFIAIAQHKDYPLIIAANRDEAFERPTESAHFWTDYPGLYAGRDLQAGGSWLGVNVAGQIAAVTNLRMPDNMRSDAKSRGELIPKYLSTAKLEGSEAVVQFEKELLDSSAFYNPFNFIYGSGQSISVFNSASGSFTRLEKGVHSVSNGAIQENWPKMFRGKERLSDYLSNNPQPEAKQLADLLADATLVDDSELPDTGVGLEAERILSSIFIRSKDYGTRTSSILLCRHDSISFYERNYGVDAVLLGDSNIDITVT